MDFAFLVLFVVKSIEHKIAPRRKIESAKPEDARDKPIINPRRTVHAGQRPADNTHRVRDAREQIVFASCQRRSQADCIPANTPDKGW
jgi:hypothetical protein